MSTAATDYLESLKHLPPGGRLVFQDVDFEDYEGLLLQLGESSHLRVSYSDGCLEIMSPTKKHEKYKCLMNELVLILCYELERDVISLGSFTMKMDRLAKGTEADDSFYIQHAAVARNEDLELGKDPPPDLVVEVDLTHDPVLKCRIYAALGIPEIWLHDGSRLLILHLVDGAYLEGGFSVSFPFLSADKLTQLIETLASGTHQARRLLKEWVQANRPNR